MSASSSFECYLCGSHNDPDASFCARCSGQLLRISDAEADASEPDLTPPPIPQLSSNNVEPEKPMPTQRRSLKGNLQDQRLSDALGLTEEVTVEPPEVEEGLFAETVVTSIPRATQSSDIPRIGTRPRSVPETSASVETTGPVPYVALVILLAFTAWFGYNTVTRDTQPETIAFASTTTTLPPVTSTTTEKPERQWTANEVEGRYKTTFTRVFFFDCDAELAEGKTEREHIGLANGIAINTHNVLAENAPPEADVAEIASRTGQRRLAIVDRTPDGLVVVTSTTPTSRNLDLADSPTGQAQFYVDYNPETNTVMTDTEGQPQVISQLAVTATGDVHSVRLGSESFPASTLSAVDIRYQTIEDSAPVGNRTACTAAAVLEQVTPESETLDEDAATQDSTITTPEGAQSGASDEEQE